MGAKEQLALSTRLNNIDFLGNTVQHTHTHTHTPGVQTEQY